MKNKKKIKIIKKIALKMSGLTIKELSGRTRKAEVVAYRNAIMYLLFKECRHTTTSAGEFVGRDHATCIHAINRVNDTLRFNDTIHYPIYNKFFKKFYKKINKNERK